MEHGSNQPPLKFQDFDELVHCWLSLHCLYNVPVTAAERDFLDLDDIENDEED